MIALSLFLSGPHTISVRGKTLSIDIYQDRVNVYSKVQNKRSVFLAPEKNIISGCISTLNNENEYYLMLLVSNKNTDFADDLLIVSITDDKNEISFKIIYRKDLTELKPWKIQTCDIDGDGRKEISIAMYKMTPYDPVMGKRPFIYEYTNNEIASKWLGSRLSMPFDDYIFVDINQDGKDELVSSEKLENGNKIVNAYTWKGFGFESLGNSCEFQDILKINKGACLEGSRELIYAKVIEKSKAVYYSFEFIQGRLEKK